MFYDVFVSLCNKIGKKPSAVAEELGINKSNVSNWKNNGYTPRGNTLNRIADYFNVSTDYLLNNNTELLSERNKKNIYMKNLKKLREDRGLSIKELSYLIRIPEDTMSLYESGEWLPDFDVMLYIANFYNVSIDYLLGRVEQKKEDSSFNDKGHILVKLALKDTGLLDQNGELSEEGGKIIADFIRDNAKTLKTMLQLSKQEGE